MTATVPPSRTPPNLERRTLALQLVNRRQAWHERVHGWKGGTEGALGCGNGNGDSACVCARNYAGAELSRAVADDGNDDNVETGADVNKTRNTPMEELNCVHCCHSGARRCFRAPAGCRCR